MPIIIIDESEGVVVVFGGEAEGVFGEDVAVGDAGGAGGAGDGAEGCVVVVRGDAVLRGVVEEFGNILVAVVRIKEVEPPILGAHGQRPRGDGFRGIPHELRPHGVPLRRVQTLHAEVAVINEAEVRDDLSGAGLLIVHAVARTVEGHRDYGVSGLPADGAVLGVAGDRPHARPQRGRRGLGLWYSMGDLR